MTEHNKGRTQTHTHRSASHSAALRNAKLIPIQPKGQEVSGKPHTFQSWLFYFITKQPCAEFCRLRGAGEFPNCSLRADRVSGKSWLGVPEWEDSPITSTITELIIELKSSQKKFDLFCFVWRIQSCRNVTPKVLIKGLNRDQLNDVRLSLKTHSDGVFNMFL